MKKTIFTLLSIFWIIAHSVYAADTVIRVNCGGEAFTDASGTEWVADYGFNGGTIYNDDDMDVQGTVNDPIYLNRRYGDFSYSFKVPAGDYAVNLYFAETLQREAYNVVGGRVMDVVVEGELVLDDFDMFAEAGLGAVIVKSFDATITNDSLDIRFESVTRNATISAIEIVGESIETKPVTLEWNTVEKAEGYRLYYKTDPDGDYSQQKSIEFTDCLDSDCTKTIQRAVRTYFVVTAFAGDDESPFSNEVVWIPETTETIVLEAPSLTIKITK